MIRRGFWLVVGATGGIVGYRRATSLGRQVSRTLGARPDRPGAPAARKRHLGRETIRLSRDAREFTRDVREGMDVYFDRQRARSAPTLGPSRRALTPHGRNDEREEH